MSDQTVLVTGGAGRVGYYAIQWAKISGAEVIATASNDADRQACLDVGADHVVNHREDEWGLAVLDLNQGKKVDRVVDVEFGANLPNVLSCICTSGTIATYSSMVVPEPALPFRQMMFMDLTLRLVIVLRYAGNSKDRCYKRHQSCVKVRSASPPYRRRIFTGRHSWRS